MTTGEKIRNRRLELHMTMEDLGRAIGVQRSAINKYEKGMVDIKIGWGIPEFRPVESVRDPSRREKKQILKLFKAL